MIARRYNPPAIGYVPPPRREPMPSRRKYTRLSEETIKLMRVLRAEGQTLQEIGEYVGVSTGVVHTYVKRGA